MSVERKPRVDSIRMWTSKPQRPKPKAGDLRETKAHGKQVRVHVMHNGMRVCSGSRYWYEWIGYDEARTRGLSRLLPAEAAAKPAEPTLPTQGDVK